MPDLGTIADLTSAAAVVVRLAERWATHDT